MRTVGSLVWPTAMTPASTPPQSHRAHCGTSRPKRGLPALSLVPLLLVALCASQKAPPKALGTLEYDRIALPSPAAEPIVAIQVREG